MKRVFFITITFLTITSLYAQGVSDAMRFAQTDLNGTARYRAMSGAFGALGGDLSALSTNPAGSVVFANNQAGFTFTNFNSCNKSTYFDQNTNDNSNSFNLNQAGAVFVFKNDNPKSDWKKFAIALNYDNTRNLDNSILTAGTNPTHSIDNYFLSYADGVTLGVLKNYYFDELFYNEQQAWFGYDSYIIDPNNTTDTNTNYSSNVSNGGNYYQVNYMQSTGHNSKFSFNFSTQYKDKLSIGINLNSHFISYNQSSSFYESNDNPKNTTGTTVNQIQFNNNLYTYGSGFSMQLGAIFKPTKEIRFGFSYESPTWYKLNDELNQSVVTSGYGLNTTKDNTIYSSVTTNPNTTILFQPYKLHSPSKFTGSFAYIFGKKGLISLDYTMKDYSNTEYKPADEFVSTNNFMATNLLPTSEIKFGSEYKIERLSVRGGYRWEQSPYKNGTIMGDLIGVSGGLGYNFGATKLDISFSHAQRSYDYQFFTRGLTDAARIKANTNNVSVTLLFEL